MALIRVAFLELLICVHVIGAAVLFRRFFPRENPWFGFVVPLVGLVATLNFFEHFVALPTLGWLLPFTLGGMIWTIVRPGYSWDGLRFPCVLFVGTFTFMLLLKCISPDIPTYTEGLVDLTRVLSYCTGERVPPTDPWMPPYDQGGYYSFQHYGASLLKRLFSVDIGTALNLSFALLLALLAQMGAAVAFAISGRKWIATAIVFILVAGSSGSVPVLMWMGHPDYALSTSLNTAWDGGDNHRNPFAWLCAHDAAHPDLTLVAPMYTIYCSEFHANIGATILTMTAVLATLEAYRAGRHFWPWICLLVLPMVTVITSAWYFLIAFVLCVGGFGLAFLAGRRPSSWMTVLLASAIGVLFAWPSFMSLSGNSFSQSFVRNAWEDHTPLWMFGLQWWPIFIPWLCLFFLWNRMNLMARWFQIIVPVIFITIEFFSLSARYFTVQKMWGDLYGIGMIAFYPILFVQRGVFFRLLTVFIVGTFLYCLGYWMKITYYDSIDATSFAQLSGDHGLLSDPQRRRIYQTLCNLRGATVLPGKCYWAYNLSPFVVTVSLNRCYISYTFQEEQYGHGGETDYRSKITNDLYSGAMTNPLPFLQVNNIAAVVIWPEDIIPDNILQQIKNELSSQYFYVDCKMDGEHNAGVFMRQAVVPAVASVTPPLPLNLAPHPNP